MECMLQNAHTCINTHLGVNSAANTHEDSQCSGTKTLRSVVREQRVDQIYKTQLCYFSPVAVYPDSQCDM